MPFNCCTNYRLRENPDINQPGHGQTDGRTDDGSTEALTRVDENQFKFPPVSRKLAELRNMQLRPTILFNRKSFDGIEIA